MEAPHLRAFRDFLFLEFTIPDVYCGFLGGYSLSSHINHFSVFLVVAFFFLDGDFRFSWWFPIARPKRGMIELMTGGMDTLRQ